METASHEPFHPLRMPAQDPESHRTAIVLHEVPGAREASLGEQPLDDLRQTVEGVPEARRVGHIGVAEAGIVRRQHVESLCQRGDQVPELVG